MNILCVIGSESHTTSSGWSKLCVNGKQVAWRDAKTKKWVSQFGDKHASWCECTFAAQEGDLLTWEAGSNSGNRGKDQERIHKVYKFDPNVEIVDLAPLPYPAKHAHLMGRLVLVEDKLLQPSDHDEALKGL